MEIFSDYTLFLSWLFTEYPLRVLICEFPVLLHLKRKKHFPLLYTASSLVYLIISLFLYIGLGKNLLAVYCIIVLVLSFVLSIICFEGTIKELAFCVTAGQLMEHCLMMILGAYNIYYKNQLEPFLFYLFYGLIFSVFLVIEIFVIHKLIQKNPINYTSKRLLVFVITGNAITMFIYFWAMLYGIGAHPLYRLMELMVCLLLILLQFGFFRQSYLEEKNKIAEQLLQKEKLQHQLSAENIEIINEKCHDMKHQMLALKNIDNKDTFNEALSSLTRDIGIYDMIAKTGNKALDVIITEKNFLFEKEKIMFSYIIDPEALNKMQDSDVYSLFGNALDNALEALKQEETPNRNLTMNVKKRGETTIIHIDNYCSHSISFENGLPLTRKENKNEHGFGLRSISTIVKRYHGNLLIHTENNRFNIDITLSY